MGSIPGPSLHVLAVSVWLLSLSRVCVCVCACRRQWTRDWLQHIPATVAGTEDAELDANSLAGERSPHGLHVKGESCTILKTLVEVLDQSQRKLLVASPQSAQNLQLVRRTQEDSDRMASK